MLLCTQCGAANPQDCSTCLRCQMALFRTVESPEFESSTIHAISSRVAKESEFDEGRFEYAPTEIVYEADREMDPFDQYTSAMAANDATLIATPPPSQPLAEVLPELKPWLVVVRGEKLNVSYPVLPGANVIGRMSEQPVDIDVDGQEPQERVWTSRRHAMIHATADAVFVEDLASLNGTFVNRTKLQPGARKALQEGDIIQMGTIQLAVRFSADRP